MDADRHLVGQGIPHFVHIANAGRHGFDVTGQHVHLKTSRHPTAIGHAAVRLTRFRAAQHANQAPHRVVVHRCGLSWAPDKAHHREAVLRIGIKQKLLVVLRMRLRQIGAEPIVVAQQGVEQMFTLGQQLLLGRCDVHQAREVG